MNVADSLAMRAALQAIPVPSIVPLLPTFLSLRERDPIDLSIITPALIWRDVFLKPGGSRISYGLFKRTLGTLVLWGVAPESIHDKPVQEGCIDAETI